MMALRKAFGRGGKKLSVENPERDRRKDIQMPDERFKKYGEPRIGYFEVVDCRFHVEAPRVSWNSNLRT